MTIGEASTETPARRVSRRGVALFAVAAAVVVVAAVVGVRGLLATPVQATHAGGRATLHGTWEPYTCNATVCEGYVQAGARSVFVVLRSGCQRPQRAAEVTLEARLDRSLGSASYRATSCPA